MTGTRLALERESHDWSNPLAAIKFVECSFAENVILAENESSAQYSMTCGREGSG